MYVPIEVISLPEVNPTGENIKDFNETMMRTSLPLTHQT